jgi:putative peptidoglycan lipid II flippase
MFNQIFNSRTKTVTFAAILLGISAVISGILGLVSDIILAGKFGIKAESNIYFAAFRIPDLVYNLLIVGGLGIAFLPIFSEYYSKDKKEAWKMTNLVLNVFLFLLFLISLILFIFTPVLIRFIAPGFSPEDKVKAVSLTRIMFLSPIFFGLSSVFSGILQYFNRFLVYSIAPIFYNLGIIFGMVVLTPKFGVLGLGYGVIIGAFLHWIIQIPSAINSGFSYKPLFDFKFPAIKRIFYLMVPRIFALAGQQINLIVITAIASTISGGIAIFSFSNAIFSFPIGIIGTSFAIAVFPTLSRHWANGQKKEFFDNFSVTFRQILYLIIPISILIFILRAQIIRLVYGTFGANKFDWVATRLTAASLGIFSIGILASALIPFIFRAFFALQDTKTPTLIAIFSIILNIVLSFFFVNILKFSNVFQNFIINVLKLKGIDNISVVGLSLAYIVAAIFQFLLLLFFLYKKVGDLRVQEIYASLKKIIFSSIILTVFTYLTLYVAASFVDTHTVLGIFGQTILAAAIGTVFYVLVSFYLKSQELKTIYSSILKQFHADGEY